MNIKNINNIYGQYVNSGGVSGRYFSKTFSVKEKKAGVKQDSLSFSSEAALIRNNAKTVREYASEITSNVSEERIDALRRKIQNGEYKVDSEQVANSILDRYV